MGLEGPDCEFCIVSIFVGVCVVDELELAACTACCCLNRLNAVIDNKLFVI